MVLSHGSFSLIAVLRLISNVSSYVIVVYKSLESFTNEIEMAVGCDPGSVKLHWSTLKYRCYAKEVSSL